MKKGKVMAFGTFDLLHKGHIHFLRTASKYGKLTVIVARDENVKRLKGEKPQNNEKIRLKNIARLPFVFKAIPGSLNNKYRAIERIKPDVICLGYDQKVSIPKLRNELKKRNVKARVIRLKAYKPRIYKSSILKRQYAGRGRNFYKSLNHG